MGHVSPVPPMVSVSKFVRRGLRSIGNETRWPPFMGTPSMPTKEGFSLEYRCFRCKPFGHSTFWR